MHVVVTANRWADIRPMFRDQIGTRFELRLGDPSESEVNRRVAVTVPTGRPGRGLTSDELHFLTALPRLDSGSSVHDVALGLRKAVAAVAEAWSGWTAPAIKLLPTSLRYEDLPADEGSVGTRSIPLGVDEENLATVHLDFDRERHFLAFADNESGKTNLLRTIVCGITERYSPKEAVVLLVDYRRTMLGFIDSEQHLIGYAVSANQLVGMVSDVRASLSKRLPTSSLTVEELRDRSWWTGPELFVVVDDYDLVATTVGANPLLPLVEFLPQAADVGLHLIVARRTGGASRALYDPVVGKLRELSTPGIVMSGNRDEGVLLGTTRPSALPPGRGTLVRRREGQSVIQVAWTPEHSPAVSRDSSRAGVPIAGRTRPPGHAPSRIARPRVERRPGSRRCTWMSTKPGSPSEVTHAATSPSAAGPTHMPLAARPKALLISRWASRLARSCRLS